jgi:hypothetical protein
MRPALRRFGDRERFCVEIGEPTPHALRTVDLWAAGKWLTTSDNTAYVPAFSYAIRTAAAQVRRRDVSPSPFPRHPPEEVFRLLRTIAKRGESDLPERFWLMHWGPNTDNLTSYVHLDGDDLVILFSFWRRDHPFPEDLGRIFVARVPADEFATVLEQAAGELDSPSTQVIDFGRRP